jgi:hypothetical protein
MPAAGEKQHFANGIELPKPGCNDNRVRFIPGQAIFSL